MSLNCASINAKIDEIKIKLQEINNNGTEIHALCLQETWLSDDSDTSLLQIDDFNLIPQGKICSAHAGLLIYLRKDIKYKVLHVCPKSTIWEGQFIQLTEKLANKKIVLGNIYRPPMDTNENYKQFISEFATLLAHLDRCNSDVIIGGDFNIDLLKVNDKPIVSEYLDMVISHGFFPKITLPTRLSERSGTLIDNFLCKLTHNFAHISAGILVCRISDHFPYFLRLDYGQIKRVLPPPYIRERPINDVNLQNFKSDIINSHLLDRINADTNDIDVKYDILHDTLTNAINKHIPVKTVKGIIKSIRFRDNLYLKLKKTPIDSIEFRCRQQNLKTYNGILRRNIKLAKRFYYNDRFVKYKHDIKNTWRTIKELICRKSPTNNFPDYFQIGDEKEYDKATIAHKFNTYFASIGIELASAISNAGDITYKYFLQTPIADRFTFVPVNDEAIIRIIDNLKSKTSYGHDGLSSLLLKTIKKKDISGSLAIIINQSLDTGVFPNKLKLAKVVPIFKKDDDTKFSNYRPISILPTISKVFERIIFEQLYNYLNSLNLFYHGQYGFRENHSTELAALELIDRIIQYLDKGETPISVFLDLSKAFDTLDHSILLSKLEYYGIRNNALKLFKNYLSNRKQYG